MKEATSRWSLWGADDLRRASERFRPCVVALGTFDGVHLGHRRILQRASELARSLGVPPLALTFDRHPAATLAPAKSPRLLSTFETRLDLILAEGVQHAVVVRFDAQFAAMDADSFVRNILAEALKAKGIVVGFNFRYGRGRAGDANSLKDASGRFGFALDVVPPVTVGEEAVSSTRIRILLESGNVEAAAELLGRHYAIAGRVVTGDRRGRTLGFPTANLEEPAGIAVPQDGVYATRVQVDGEDMPRAALTVIGTRPSFGASRRTIETFILDFAGDLYGKAIDVRFLRRVRGIVAFNSAAALKAQIERDVEAARAYFADRPI